MVADSVGATCWAAEFGFPGRAHSDQSWSGAACGFFTYAILPYPRERTPAPVYVAEALSNTTLTN
jgi:hypothetical protein